MRERSEYLRARKEIWQSFADGSSPTSSMRRRFFKLRRGWKEGIGEMMQTTMEEREKTVEERSRRIFERIKEYRDLSGLETNEEYFMGMIKNNFLNFKYSCTLLRIDHGACYELDRRRITRIGRGHSSKIQNSDKKVSERHAIVIWEWRRPIIIDIGSDNGTFVNGIKEEEKVLENFDVVSLGDPKENAYLFIDLRPRPY